ncbi:MAG: sulfatase family protein [Planctomycetota bacterium]|jgi:arylsulfatase A-like enzyme
MKTGNSDYRKKISRREFLWAGAGIAASGFAVPSLQAMENKSRRPNILYVFSDMQRATSLGCYGDPNVHTPALDAFAKEGIRFDAAMANTPVCGPYRACLMTGLYSHNNGVVSNGVKFTRKVRGLAEQFRDAGYVTGYAGKWHIPSGHGSDDSMPLGFPREQIAELVLGRKPPRKRHHLLINVTDAAGNEVQKKVYAPTYYADKAIHFIEEKSKDKTPWLFFLSWKPPHGPYASPPQYRKHYEGKLQLPPNVPAGAATKNALKCLPDYYGMVESLDAEFKRILDALDRAGVAEDTIVCYSSDHGDMIGSQGYKFKRWPYEESARVPLLIRYPRKIRAGQVIADPISTVDMYPTLTGLAGLKTPSGIDGLDYSPMLTGKTDKPPRDYAFLQMLYAYVPWPGWRALRTKDYMYARTVKGPWLLFNTAKDPYQMKNLVDDPAFEALAKKMENRLAAIMKESGDSWDIKAASGNVNSWIPKGTKQKSQDLGTPLPGNQEKTLIKKGKK